jgi:hypothetical protein
MKTVRRFQKWNVINVIYIQNDACSYQSRVISGYISNIYWHASKWSSISFSHWQCPSDREFSFPRFVGLLILSLWVWLTAGLRWGRRRRTAAAEAAQAADQARAHPRLLAVGSAGAQHAFQYPNYYANISASPDVYYLRLRNVAEMKF